MNNIYVKGLAMHRTVLYSAYPKLINHCHGELSVKLIINCAHVTLILQA